MKNLILLKELGLLFQIITSFSKARNKYFSHLKIIWKSHKALVVNIFRKSYVKENVLIYSCIQPFGMEL